MKVKPVKKFTPLELETRPTVDTATYAHHMLLAEQTVRAQACSDSGPIRPIRIPGSSKLRWPVPEMKRLLRVK